MGRRSSAVVIAGLLACDGSASTTTPPPSAPETSPPTSDPVPSEPKPMSQTHPFLSSDQDFYAADADARATPARDALLEAGFTGISIDAPFVVDATARVTLPILGVFARPASAPGNLARDAMVVLIDREGDGFAVAPALQSEKGDPDEASAGGSGVVAESFAFDARARVTALGWGHARVRAYVIHRASRSNGIDVSIEGDPVATLPSPAVLSVEAAPTEPTGRDPLVLTGAARAVTEPGGSVPLVGAVRASGDRALVHLVAVGDAPSPFTVSLSVPLEDGAGSFSINLLGDNGLPKAPGTWHVYAFRGEHAAGPVTVALTPGETPW